jgi:hypothetical protein
MPTGSSSLLTVADPTDTGPGSGNTNSHDWPPRLDWKSLCPIIRLAPANGNKIEHRLFSRITQNWRGRPLETYQTIVNLIASTTTTTGLTVRCELDSNLYPTKIKLYRPAERINTPHPALLSR